MELSIHADRRQAAIVDAAELPWVPSPSAGVERRMLERIGGEVALATSIVRYAPGSRFPTHRHELGEEFVVLEGTFSDESGDYERGSYVRNPAGSSHAPHSREGCVIFVKLRQMEADEPEQVRVRVADRRWQDEPQRGVRSALLYANPRTEVRLLSLDRGARLPLREVTGGEEMLVVDGSVALADRRLGHWGWHRSAEVRQPGLHALEPALLWVKRGHL